MNNINNINPLILGDERKTYNPNIQIAQSNEKISPCHISKGSPDT